MDKKSEADLNEVETKANISQTRDENSNINQAVGID